MKRTLGNRRRRRLTAMVVAVAAIAAAPALHRLADGAGLAAATLPASDRWRGLAVAPEYRCAPYDRADYPYPQSIEARIVRAQGGRIYGPYTGRWFRRPRESDIEHIVAVSEAHDSGLCAADLLNLTLASPAVNRCGRSGKCAFDAAQWLPPMNRCWFAARIVAVRLKYRLTVDRREAGALERILSGCASTAMIVTGE